MLVKYLKKLALFIFPILVFYTALEITLRSIPNDFQEKHAYLNSNSDKIETLILGSSHSLSFVNPDNLRSNAFNAAQLHQTLKYDYYILNEYHDKLKSLKTVVLPISYGSFFSSLENSKDKWRIKNYKMYFDYKDVCSPRYSMEIFNGHTPYQFQDAVNYLSNGKTLITCNTLGFGEEFSQTPQTDLNHTGAVVAKRHTEDCSFEYYDENLQYITKIIKLCESNNIKLVLYTAPSYHTYYENLEDKYLAPTFETIDTILKDHPNIKYKSYLKDKRFTKDDFRDVDHLNLQGAKKFTEFLEKELIES
ncbi:MAG: hypothetical protein R2852_10225 [Bacteroidia bacterium]